MKRSRIYSQQGNAMIEYVMLCLIGAVTISSLPLPTSHFDRFNQALNPAGTSSALRQPPGSSGGFGGGLIGSGGTETTRNQGLGCPPERVRQGTCNRP